MSELKAALQAIARVDFSQTTATESARIGRFLERAAAEVTAREDNVSQREREVSKREAAITLREDQVEQELKALSSIKNVRRALDLPPRTAVQRVGWFGRGR